MASVTFPISVGGDGSTVTDDANATTGLANGGHRTRFVPSLAQMVAVASNTVTQATNAAASAASALTAPGTNATSTSSLAIGTGSKSLTLAQTGKSFVVGQWVSISSTTTPSSQWMLGAITAFTSGTGAMTVNVTSTAGSGTLTSWVIAAASPVITPTSSTIGTLTEVTGTSQTAVKDVHYYLSNVAATTVTLPLNPANGDTVWVTVCNGLATNVIARNGAKIMNVSEDMTLDNPSASVQLRYINATYGWALL